MVSPDDELPSIQVVVEVVDSLDHSEQLSSGHTVVPLWLGEGLTVEGHNLFCVVLHS